MPPLDRDFTRILLEHRVISPQQLAEAKELERQTGVRLADALIRLGHASSAQVMLACAEALGVAFLDLSQVEVPRHVIERVPESVARENLILPLAAGPGRLTIAISDFSDFDTLQKLQFILNTEIQPVLALREQIIAAIHRHYGDAETESVESFLDEFTDTAIDFTPCAAPRSPSAPAPIAPADDGEGIALSDADYMELSAARSSWGSGLIEFKKGVGGLEEEPEEESSPARRQRSGASVRRRATVRYYDRMTSERMFPLLVVLSRQAIGEVVQQGVRQAQSRTFKVEEGSLVEVEPILPGCQCYPSRSQVRIGTREATARFWVVPHVLGTLMEARVVIRQEGEVLAEVPLEARVVRQGLTVLMGGLSLVLPFVLLLLRHFRLDFESQLQDGFSVYAYLIDLALHALTPEMLTALLLALTAVAYLCLRPRKRDLFWDVTPHGAGEKSRPQTAAAPVYATAAARQAECPQQTASAGTADSKELGGFREDIQASQEAMLKQADTHFEAGEYSAALRLYEQALKLGHVLALHYFRAALAAHRMGNTAHALEILLHAQAVLPDSEMRGEMWYSMGCFAACLGRFPEAIRFLSRAVDAGYDRPEQYREDPALDPLRGHPGFKRLLLGAGS